MKTLIVGNRFLNYIDNSLLNEESEIETSDTLSLDIMTPRGFDLIIWDYHMSVVKDKGSVLICVGDDNIGDSLKKVFQTRANGVICLIDNMYHLVDALGNLWCKTEYESELLNNVLRLYKWTKTSIRKESLKTDSYTPYDINTIPDLKSFCQIIRSVSDKVENERGGRYFGNASTRCSKMFPSIRGRYDSKQSHTLFQYILVSKRNIPKDRIQPEDFVVTRFGSSSEDVGKVLYYGEDKPSVDTPSQIWLYNEFPNINYMIHGHAYISSEFLGINLIKKTSKYCSCGDLREVEQIKEIVGDKETNFFIVNLTNHGFIIATDTLERMEDIVEHPQTNFIYRKIGEEIPKI